MVRLLLKLNPRQVKIFLNIVTVISTVLCLAFIVYGLKTDLFTSEEKLKNFLMIFGSFGPLILISIQALQVVFPAVPLGVGLLVSVFLFGPFKGFIYNYIGVCIGSIMAFLIAKKYGIPVLELIFPKRLLKKYSAMGKSKKFISFFALAIFFPIAPDDFLCYLAGTTEMHLKTFVPIIIFGKPLSIACYTFGLKYILMKFAPFVAAFAS